MAKRDGWKVETDKPDEFKVAGPCAAIEWAIAFATQYGTVYINTSGARLPPARAIQFARKVQDIAARQANRHVKKGAGDAK